MSLRRLQTEERGWALIVAIMVMVLVLSVGLAMMSVVDRQAREGGLERVREASFNLGEGALYQQSLILSRQWPRTAALKYPNSCLSNAAAATDNHCPLPSALASGASGGNSSSIFNSVDYGGSGNASWTLTVRDNGDASGNPTTNYSVGVANGAQGTCSSPCTWDANGDKKLWVRAESTVRGKIRRMVALVQLEQVHLPFPGNVIQAGWVHAANSGNKVIVDTKGSATTGSQVVVNCSSTTTDQHQNPPCTGWDPAQVNPPSYCTTNKSGCPNPVGNALTPQLIQQLEGNADIVYNNTCPPGTVAAWTGVILINATSNSLHCDLGVATPVNSNSTTCDPSDPSSKPGLIIMTQGTLSLSHSQIYCGIIYMTNEGTPPITSASTPVVVTGSQVTVFGGIIVDNGGGVEVGQACGGTCSTATITFDPNAFSRISAAGTAGLVQNTWRELTPTQ